MGRRGPAPTPTPILQLRGSWRANARKNEPSPARKAPAKPRGMSREASATWDYLVPKLVKMGVLAEVDRNALHRYCETWARWKRAGKFLRENGETYPLYETDKNGNERVKYHAPFPEVSIYRGTSDMLHRMEQQFGLSPSARASIEVPNGMDEESELEKKFFSR